MSDICYHNNAHSESGFWQKDGFDDTRKTATTKKLENK